MGGGYETTVPSLSSHWLNVYESQRVGARQWRVSGVQSFAGTDTLIVYAYCEARRQAQGSLRARWRCRPMPSDSAVVQANCPGGTKAISGGFAIEAAKRERLRAWSTRAIAAGGDRWVVDATRLEGSAARTLVAHAYCAAAR